MQPKLRLKILEKIAQTTLNLPTDQISQTKTVAGSPPTFIATDYYPSIILGFSAKNAPIINGLSNLLNNALYYSSNGQVNLSWMRSNNFNFGTSQVPSIDLKNIMELCKLLYNKIYTDLGQSYKKTLTSEEISEKVKLLDNSQYLSNLSSVQPTSQLATKIGGNLKTLIHNYLAQIK